MTETKVSADTDSSESQGLGPKSEAEEALRASLGPIVWKIGALEQQNIKDIFALLKRFFNVFAKEGVVEKKDLKFLKSYGLMNADGETRLGTYTTQTPGKFTFSEFASFFASELLKKKAADEKDGKKKDEGTFVSVDLPEETQSTLDPIVFLIDARTDDMHRIFGLFNKMFECFKPKEGRMDLKDMQQLVETGLLDTPSLKLFEKLDTEKRGSVDFEQFLAFWIHHFVEVWTAEQLTKTNLPGFGSDSVSPSSGGSSSSTTTTSS